MTFDLTPSANREGIFVLNRSEYAQCRILIGGENFGCGFEPGRHAVWGPFAIRNPRDRRAKLRRDFLFECHEQPVCYWHRYRRLRWNGHSSRDVFKPDDQPRYHRHPKISRFEVAITWHISAFLRDTIGCLSRGLDLVGLLTCRKEGQFAAFEPGSLGEPAVAQGSCIPSRRNRLGRRGAPADPRKCTARLEEHRGVAQCVVRSGCRSSP